ncbi:MAG: cation diffusion facilitator family transporter [Candidatus Nitrosotalea sp.]|nr:cation diffusion facilitator family transporter [Candidatus Nitrosotalea sp.]
MSEAREQISIERISKLKIVLILTATYFVAEIVGSLVTNSLALLADAGHMLTDVGGLALSLLAIHYTRRKATPHRTYGFYRMEILVSLANSVALILLSIYIFYEGYRHIFQPPEISSIPMTIIGGFGLIINLAGIRILGGHSHSEHHESHEHHEEENLNIKGARLEVLSDMIGAVGVIVTGLIIFTTKFYLADAIFSIGLALFILPRTWALMKKSINILMEGVPSNIDYEEIKNAILQVKGVTGIFDLHIWTITSGMDALSAHVVTLDTTKSQAIILEIRSILEKKFNIIHSTIQIETYH